MSRGTTLRRLLQLGEIIVAPSVYDAYGARMVERAGFQALAITGNAVSAAMLGRPDVGLLTMSEVVDNARRIAAAVKIPVIADADTGYGSAINVVRTVQEFEAAGMAAIFLEDQESPKKCGHMAGPRPVISMEEMLGKLEAAVWARNDPDLLLIGRTDAAQSEGLEGAIARARAYGDAGADLIYIHVHGSRQELQTIGEAIDKPLTVNMDEAGGARLLSLEELRAMGYRVATYPGVVRYTVAWAVQQALAELKATGSTAALRDRMASFGEYNAILGLEEIESLSRRFGR